MSVEIVLASRPTVKRANPLLKGLGTALPLALALATFGGGVLAQATEPAAAASPSRSQVRMETREFLRTHRWDEPLEIWVLKSGIEPPTGVVSRAAVRAKRDEFMRLNRWDEPTDTWVARSPAAPMASTLTREQVRVEMAAFAKTHTWDEETESWISNRPMKAR